MGCLSAVQPKVDETVRLDLKMSHSRSMKKSTVMAVVRAGIERRVRRRGDGFMVWDGGRLAWMDYNAGMLRVWGGGR